MPDTSNPGDSRVLCHMRGDCFWAVAAAVVEDQDDYVAVYVRPGNGMSRMGTLGATRGHGGTSVADASRSNGTLVPWSGA